jgi:large subunit ribosomal protein L25
MAILKVNVEPREETGTRASRKLRDSGFIPANLYSHGDDAKSIKLDSHKWSRYFTDALNLVTLEFPDGASQVVAVREIQRDPMSQTISHIDFLGVRMDEKIKFDISLNYEGIAEGTKEGGVLTISSEMVAVECSPTDVPDSITVDITELKIGDSINAGDITMPDKVELASDPAMTLVSVTTVRIVEEEEPEEPAEGEAEGVEGEEKPEGEAGAAEKTDSDKAD